MSPGLLVSVRDREEALDALTAGADLIDMKEPSRGSLGAVDVATMHDVVAAIGGRVPLSVALGELAEAAPDAASRVPDEIAWVKFGLAGCRAQKNWSDLLRDALAQLPAATSGVAVVYADDRRAAAPAPEEVLEYAGTCGCRALLIDTWSKQHGGVIDLWGPARCESFAAQARAAGLKVVIAGSLNRAAIVQLGAARPDYFAVRGAVCSGARDTRLDPSRVAEMVALLRPASAAVPR